MFRDYLAIREPLNLEEGGRAWFRDVFDWRRPADASAALVLGATPWMIEMLLHRQCRQVVAVDMSASMVQLAQGIVGKTSGNDLSKVQFHQSNWLDLSPVTSGIDVVLGDNSLSFLGYPKQWSLVCDHLADRMNPNGTLITRCLSMPKRHKPLSMQEIVDTFISRSSINYTEVRATLLFSRCNRGTYAIDTEQVLEYFESRRADLEPLFSRFPITEDDDLLTVSKYRSSRAVYYAPPLEHVLDVIGKRFRVTDVHFGPYSMAEYFPLIVASRK